MLLQQVAAVLHNCQAAKIRVTLKAGYIIKEALPSYIIHGTEGSFIKQRADVQETQLQQGLHPDVIGYGIESDETKGLLHTNTVKEYVATENVCCIFHYNYSGYCVSA